MFGANDMGELKISTGVTAPDNELFIESGNHDDQWNKGMVTFTTSPGMKVLLVLLLSIILHNFVSKFRH